LSAAFGPGGLLEAEMMSERAVIFVNGELKDDQALQFLLRSDDYLIAVDGGYHHMKRMGLHPSILVGDLDSLSASDLSQLETGGVDIRRFTAEKDETDLELALQIALDMDFQVILIVAALGGRLDQTIANLLLLTHPDLSNRDVRMDDGLEEVLLIRHKAVIEGMPGDTVSLLPLYEPARRIVTEGLYYPLRAETLWPEGTRGMSNVMTAPRANVHLGEGQLLCIHTRQSGPSDSSPLAYSEGEQGASGNPSSLLPPDRV